MEESTFPLDQGDLLSPSELYGGLLWRRPVAYGLDICVIGMISAAIEVIALLLGFGDTVKAVPPMLLIIFIYFTYFLGQRGATWGMGKMDLKVQGLKVTRVSYPRAFVRFFLFLLSSVSTAGIISLVHCFNSRRRGVHDMITDTIVVRSSV